MSNATTTPKYTFTPDTIAALRDDQQQSWAKVAAALELGSPGAARRAYTALVRPHTESVLTDRATGDGKVTPVDLSGLDLDALRDRCVGRTLVVQRKNGTEEIPCAKVTSVKGDTMNFGDGTKARSVKTSAVVAVK
ncbi:MAG: hypothetical protein ACSLE8_07875 [Rhodococcus sp. (in: high G+C Gram-positive bacteria)]